MGIVEKDKKWKRNVNPGLVVIPRRKREGVMSSNLGERHWTENIHTIFFVLVNKRKEAGIGQFSKQKRSVANYD